MKNWRSKLKICIWPLEKQSIIILMAHVNIHQKKCIAEKAFNKQMDKNNISVDICLFPHHPSLAYD